MEFSIKKRAEKFLRKQGKKGGKTAAKILAAAVAVVTVAALAMPALTMEKEANCGIEEHTHTPECYEKVLTCTKGTVEKASLECTLHQHTKECYKDKDPKKELICGYADYAVHHHDKNCYIDGKLVCQLKELEEHQHTDDCYKTEKTLVCGKEESEGHTHSDSCYEEKKELTCGKEESEGHQHGDDCYDEEGNLICEKEESEGHQHSDDCYKVTKELTCGKEESEGHKHSDDCYETEKVLKCDKPEIVLHQHTQECFNENPDKNHKHTDECKNADGVYVCGGLKCDKIDVRKHQHSDDEIVKPDATHEHTDACYEEQLVCGKEEHTHTEDCYNVEKAQTEDEQKDGEAKEEANGEDDDKAETVAMPETFEYEDENVSVVLHVEGDATVMEESENAEAEGEADADQTEEQQNGEPKAEAGDTAETGEPEENEEMAALGMTGTPDEAEDSQSKETNADDAAADENAENGENAEAEAKETAPVMQVEKLEEGSEQYQEVVNYAEENEGIGEEYSLSVLKFHFYQEGKELDVSNCKINAEVTPKRQMIEPYEAGLDEEQETTNEAEIGVAISVMSGTGKELSTVNNAFVEKKGVASPIFNEVTVKNEQVAVIASQEPDPVFTVEYYAKLNINQTTNTYNQENTIRAINTKDKNLPKNGTNPTTKIYQLDKANGNDYKLKTKQTETLLFAPKENIHYKDEPNLSYFDKCFEKNKNYKLVEIRITADGQTHSYTDVENIHFTNRKQSEASDRIYIKDGATIRLIYEPTTDDIDVNADFYDYDTSDGKFYTSVNNAKSQKEGNENQPGRSQSTYIYTNRQGINSGSNYTGSGAKLGFGNANSGSGLENETFNGANINKYNSEGHGSTKAGFQGCSFGIVGSHNASAKTVNYTGGIIGPNLFGGATAAGKTALSGYELVYSREGDTYTLSKVKNGNGDVSSATELKYFNHPNNGTETHMHILTNDFWPMDNNGLGEVMFGDHNHLNVHYVGQSANGTLPVSDDGKDHNSYFGMCSSVNFQLTEDYRGPLEYFFYGDDDMWVFLDNTLICDIGGVHSSVGEYVDLWDYIKEGDTKKHTLYFYYTERGESGSSCFIQFTLPSVTDNTPGQNTGALRVEKEVEGAVSSDAEFGFYLTLDHANGAVQKDDFRYELYEKGTDGNDKLLDKNLVTHSGTDIVLKHNQYIIVEYLPEGTTYTITETDPGGYSPKITVSGGISGTVTEDENKASGGITKGNTAIVKFVNTPVAVLPKTGGAGTMIFTITGGALILIAAGVYAEQLRRRRQKSL